MPETETPKWATEEPPSMFYDLVLSDSWGSVDGWSFTLTREEFLFLRDQLAVLRGHIPATVTLNQEQWTKVRMATAILSGVTD